jgi:hypothetical protein
MTHRIGAQAVLVRLERPGQCRRSMVGYTTRTNGPVDVVIFAALGQDSTHLLQFMSQMLVSLAYILHQ